MSFLRKALGLLVEFEEDSSKDESIQERSVQTSQVSGSPRSREQSLDDLLLAQIEEGVVEGSKPTKSKPISKRQGLFSEIESSDKVASKPPSDFKLADIPSIYATANISDSSVSNIEVLIRLLDNPKLLEVPLEHRVSSVSMALDAIGADLESIVEDAVTRDQALDTYFGLKKEELDRRCQSLQSSIFKKEKEIEEFKAKKTIEIRELYAEIDGLQSAFNDWAVLKRDEEFRLYDTIKPFITSKNPISIDEEIEDGG